MKKLKIDKIENYNYYLKEKDNTYIINMEFFDIDYKPISGDIIYMDESLLKEKILNVGIFKDSYGKKIIDSNDLNIIILESKNKRFYLKRLYG